MPALLTDLIISFDDKWLFVAGWLHGVIWRFDISDPFRVSLHSSLALGGLFVSEKNIIPSMDTKEASSQQLLMTCRSLQPRPVVSLSPITIRGIQYRGGPAIFQLSLDGRRLYVGNSFYKSWDTQFFPDIIRYTLSQNKPFFISDGGQLVKVDITPKGLELNPNFILDLSVKIDGGPYVSRDLHFFEGDCTGDNFL